MENVKSLCKTADVIALQETWLLQHDLQLLGDVDPNFGYTAKSAVDLSAGVLRGRPHGGVALLWRKSLFPRASIVKCQSDRIVAIKTEVEGGRSMLIISVYMPTDHVDNLPLFCQCLGEMNALIQDNNIEVVFMLGDYNAHPSAPFGVELLEFCDENDWICADLELAGGVWSLRNLSISVPRAVLSGEGQSAVLRCTYDLEGVALYSIRWYRAQTEFYRYVPREMPPTMVFPLPGASVDLAASDHQQVRIVNLNRRLSGEYQCEVTADAPLFHTDIRAAPLTVVDPPFRAPRLSVSQRTYSRGDVLRANCSVDEAYPAPNITWTLDDHKIAESVSWWTFEMDFKERGAFSQLELSVLEAEQYRVGLSYTSSSLARVYPDHHVYRDTQEQDIVRYSMVAPTGGQFALGCVATIHDIYARQADLVYIREDAPHPASVTGEDSAGTAARCSLLVIIISAGLAL